PNQDAGDGKAKIFYTAVGQVISFCLLAFKSERRSVEWRELWRNELPQWPAGQVDGIETPDSQEKETPSPSPYKGISPLTRRLFELRPRRDKKQCKEDKLNYYDDEDSSDGEVGDGSPSRKGGTGPGRQRGTATGPKPRQGNTSAGGGKQNSSRQ